MSQYAGVKDTGEKVKVNRVEEHRTATVGHQSTEDVVEVKGQIDPPVVLYLL